MKPDVVGKVTEQLTNNDNKANNFMPQLLKTSVNFERDNQ